LDVSLFVAATACAFPLFFAFGAGAKPIGLASLGHGADLQETGHECLGRHYAVALRVG
jgi:hypothetical protein